MSFARQKRLLVGWLALLAPLPLPFNDILSWPLLMAYLALVGLFLRRAAADAERWLPNWVLNVMALVYVPVLVLDIQQLSGGGLVGPLAHLLMFAVLAKLFAMTRERDKWQTLVGVLFLFLASAATSTHLTVVFYLLAFFGLMLLLLVRFACLHILSTYGFRDPAPALLPMGRFLLAAGAGIVLLAVPFFVLLPRVRSPYLMLNSAGVGGAGETAGFSQDVTLDSLGLVRDNREVVMRLTYDQPPANQELRFKAGAHDRFSGLSWSRGEGSLVSIVRAPGDYDVEISSRAAPSGVSIWLQPLIPQRLVLPVTAARVAVAAQSLLLSSGGTADLSLPVSGVLSYRVELAAESVLFAAEPQLSPDSPVLDVTAVTPAMTELAARVMGDGSSLERVKALERHLAEEYTYTLDFVGRSGKTSLEDFLFRYKSGHCEYFASSMVLLLRSQGIPARLVTGFLGADFNPIEGYYIVRQGNAHAWVEAYLPGEGWRTFDPTPASGRPAATRSTIWTLLAQGADYLTFRWDRYVLSYGFGDQVQLLMRLRDLWTDFWRELGPRKKKSLASEMEPAPSETPGETAISDGSSPWWALAWLPLILAFGALGLLGWRRRRPPTSVEAYLRLRALAERGFVDLQDSTAPLALLGRLESADAELARAAAPVVDLYLAETFGGRVVSLGERGKLPAALAEAKRLVERRRVEERRSRRGNKAAAIA